MNDESGNRRFDEINAKCGMAKLCIALRHSAFLVLHSVFLLNVRFLKSEVLLLVEGLQIDGDEQGSNSETCEDD